MSGVPMRPKVKPAPPPQPTQAEVMERAISSMANVLASSQEKLASTIAGVITSQREAKPDTSPVQCEFTKGPDGAISSGVVTRGSKEWRLSVTRSSGRVNIQVTPEKQ